MDQTLDDKRSGQRKTRGLKPRLLVAGAAIAVAAGYFAIYLAPRSSAVPVASPPAVVVTAVPRTPAAGRLVELQIRVTPPSASISIDGVPVEGNPYTVTRVADAFAHQVEAVAPGHVPSRVDFVLDSNVTLKVSLERLPEATTVPVKRTGEIGRASCRERV